MKTQVMKEGWGQCRPGLGVFLFHTKIARIMWGILDVNWGRPNEFCFEIGGDLMNSVLKLGGGLPAPPAPVVVRGGRWWVFYIVA